MLFKDIEYVLITVKAEVTVRWKVDEVVENYRFYYPYQELIVNPVISKPVDKDGPHPEEDSSSLVSELLVGLVFVVVVGGVMLGAVGCYRRYARSPKLLIE